MQIQWNITILSGEDAQLIIQTDDTDAGFARELQFRGLHCSTDLSARFGADKDWKAVLPRIYVQKWSVPIGIPTGFGLNGWDQPSVDQPAQLLSHRYKRTIGAPALDAVNELHGTRKSI